MSLLRLQSGIVFVVLLGSLFSWSLVSAESEEVIGQETDVALYLYLDDGEGKLHTMETEFEEDTDEVTITQGQSVFFSINQKLLANLPIEEYRNNVAFHIFLYANAQSFTETGHLKLYVRDGITKTDTTLDLIAEGEMTVPTRIDTQNNEEEADISWAEGYGDNWTFDKDHFVILELENDGNNDVILELDSGKDGEAPSRLIITTNPVREIDILTQSYNLDTSDPDDRISTSKFKPNLPSDVSKMFISGTALNAFGTYDIVSFEIRVEDSSEKELYSLQVDVEEIDNTTTLNSFQPVTWNYGNPVENGDKHEGAGIYSVKVSAIDQQGHRFSLEKLITMDAYGAYMYTESSQQSVPIGGSVNYQINVRNVGDQDDSFEVTYSSVSSDWQVSPISWDSGETLLKPGEEKIASFTISASDSSDMVGKSTVVVFTCKSSESVQIETFSLQTLTGVGAAFDVLLYFDVPELGQPLSKLSITGVAGEWNEYSLSVANNGQATDDVILSVLGLGNYPNWEVGFVSGEIESVDCKQDSPESSLEIIGIPRASDGYNIANVTVCVKPAEGGSADVTDIELLGQSRGNASKSSIATISITRTFGLTFTVAPQGSSGIFSNREAGEEFTIDMSLSSVLEGEHDIKLSIDAEFPDGWSYNFKKDGATITEVTISEGQSHTLKLSIRIGSQATFVEEGYSFYVLADDLADSSNSASQKITVVVGLDGGFALSSLKYKESLEPGDSYTFQLNIENKANGGDTFTLSASLVPSGWRVVFLNGNTFSVDAGRTEVVSIQITASDDARDGDQESVRVSVYSSLSQEEKYQNFVIDVEQGFTARLLTTFGDLWYVFAFLIIIIVVGFVTQNRGEFGDWEDDYEDVKSDDSSSNIAQEKSSDDEWDDW